MTDAPDSSTPPALDDFYYPSLKAFFNQFSSNINESNVSRLAAVYACEKAVAETFALIPKAIRERIDHDSFELRPDHSLHRILNRGPNDLEDCFAWSESTILNYLRHGESFSHTRRRRSGAIDSMHLIPSITMETTIQNDDKWFIRTFNDGTKEVYPKEEIFHFKMRSIDGIRGTAPFKEAPGVFKFAYFLQEHGIQFFKNGAFISGFLKIGQDFQKSLKDKETKQQFVDAFREILGASNAGKVGLLEHGNEWVPYQSHNDKAQFLELRKLAAIEIAQLYRMPPHMIQMLEDGASYSSIEQQAINFIQSAIQPHVARFEAAAKHQLLNQPGEENLEVWFDIRALMRGDLKSQTEAIVSQLQYGLLTISEGRAELGRNAFDDELSNKPLVSHNMRPLDQLLQEPLPMQQPLADEQKEALKSLVQDMFNRAIGRELKTVKYAKKRDDYTEYMQEFYSTHGEYMFDTLRSACRVLNAGGDSILREFIESYIAQREQQLLSVENLAEFIKESQEPYSRALFAEMES